MGDEQGGGGEVAPSLSPSVQRGISRGLLSRGVISSAPFRVDAELLETLRGAHLVQLQLQRRLRFSVAQQCPEAPESRDTHRRGRRLSRAEQLAQKGAGEPHHLRRACACRRVGAGARLD